MGSCGSHVGQVPSVGGGKIQSGRGVGIILSLYPQLPNPENVREDSQRLRRGVSYLQHRHHRPPRTGIEQP